jgi:phage terminase large subunit
MAVKAEFPRKLQFLFQPKRYKVAYGGRGAAKSWGFARALLIIGAQRRIKVLCAREIQKSIQDSVHALLKSQIAKLGLEAFYNVQNTSITGANGTEIIFAGLKHNINSIKSIEDVDIVWVEEAQSVSKQSWATLIPTIRKPGSEIWVSFNPDLETDDTYKRFVLHPPQTSHVEKINWSDNPWFGEPLLSEKNELAVKDPDEYQHVWEGMCKQVVRGAVYKDQLLAVHKEERITRVPYDPLKPVDTFWDLGWADMTTIWFAQSVGSEFRLIDYVQDCQKDIKHYVKELQARPYVYGTDYLPHDARAKELGSGRSIEEQLRGLGRKVQIVKMLSVEDGIAAARAIFGKCWFDADKCADGIQALSHYRYEEDEKLGTLKKAPLHDWASHGSDAFRYFAVAIQEPKQQREKKLQPKPNRHGAAGWQVMV